MEQRADPSQRAWPRFAERRSSGCVILNITRRRAKRRPKLYTSPLLPTCLLACAQHRTPLAASYFSLLLLFALSGLPLSIYLSSPSTSSPAATMVQDLKKLMPQAKASIHGPVSAEAPGYQKVEGETIPRRNVKTKGTLRLTPANGINTLYDILRYSSAKFGNAKCVGSRKVVHIHEETKKIKKMIDGKQQEVDKKWQYFELSPYEFKSFVEFEHLCLTVGSGLKKLGFAPHDRLHLFASTSMQWLASAHGTYFPVCSVRPPFRADTTFARCAVAVSGHCDRIRHARRGGP